MGEERLAFPSAETKTVIGYGILWSMNAVGAQLLLWPEFVGLVENTTNCLGANSRFTRGFIANSLIPCP